MFKTKLALIYGSSGTGKTSLIQCGLASKFDGPDWYPIWIRKNGDINLSLRKALKKALKKVAAGDSISEQISALFHFFLRPVYLIFDQFEELFILGTEQEKQKFLKDMVELSHHDLPCKVLFVMREEYLEELYKFEQHFSKLFDYRLRVKPMCRTQVEEVLKSSFKKFNIILEGKEEEKLQEMIDNVCDNGSDIQLPNLQVYLAQLYRANYKNTYQGQEKEGFWPHVVFTKEKIATTGKIDNLLEQFLLEEEEQLQTELSNQYGSQFNGVVRAILNFFVTEEGTKRPIYYRLEEDHFEIETQIKGALEYIPEPILDHVLASLERRRIIRFSDDYMELAHDTLAESIDNQRTDEQLQINDLKKPPKPLLNLSKKWVGDFWKPNRIKPINLNSCSI